MQFLKTAFWVVIAVAIALFCKANWASVPVKLWGDLVADIKLPILMIASFLLGAVPFWIALRATRWRLRKRLDAAERALATVTAAPPPAPIMPPPEDIPVVPSIS
ncbi:MAG: LapA family protein [Sphingobium sp.]